MTKHNIDRNERLLLISSLIDEVKKDLREARGCSWNDEPGKLHKAQRSLNRANELLESVYNERIALGDKA